MGTNLKASTALSAGHESHGVKGNSASDLQPLFSDVGVGAQLVGGGYLPPVTGASSLHALTDSVFAVQSDFRESDFGPMFATLQSRQAKRSLIVVLSDVSDEETSQQFRASLARLGRRHVVLFAALRTPLLNRILTEPVETLVDGAKKAVTFRLLRERQLALQSLQHGGVFVLDVEPNQLTVPLVNQFIELRQRNLL